MIDGQLLCPGDRRPCLPYSGSIAGEDGSIVWVAGRLLDGVFLVDDERSIPEQPRRIYENRCPDQDISGPPSNSILEGLYEDEAMQPPGFVDLWDSDDGVLHLGVVGEPGEAEAFLDELGIADRVCLVSGYPHSDALLETVQLAVNDAAGDAGFENYGTSRDSWEGTVTLSVPRFDQELRSALNDIGAANGDVAITIEASVEVINGSLADYDELLSQVEVLPDAGQQLTATCGSVTFSAVPPDLDEFPALDDDAQSAIDELVNGPTGVEAGGFGGDTQWSIASRTDSDLVLFGQQPAGDTVTAQFVGRDGAWVPSGWGGCRIQIEAPGLGPALVSSNPDALPSPEATELDLFITEQNCASGMPPNDREVVVLVTETADEVTIIALVAAVEGDAECPGNPLYPISVTLAEPLGDRMLIDGHRFPRQPVVPSEDFDN